MKNKLLLVVLSVLFIINFSGCGSEVNDNAFSVSFESIGATQTEENPLDENRIEVNENITVQKENAKETAIEENATEENISAEEPMSEGSETILPETDAVKSADLTFTDLAKRQFEFSSGAGAWADEFTIERDGYFTRSFHDSDMGDTGEGYADGTIYSSSYSGHFTDLTKINDYTYEMKLADISYEDTPGMVDIRDNIRYCYTDSYCLDNLGTDTYTIYLPGTPLEELSEEACNWLAMANESEDELTMIAIVDENMGFGIYSYDRLESLEDAQMTFNNYKESYDYYSSKLSEAGTTAEMVEYTGTMYEVSDDCLNYIWNLIRYNVDEDKFDEILAEQRAWIAEKEAKAKEVSSEYEGGSFAAVSRNDILAELTMKRCEELIAYLK